MKKNVELYNALVSSLKIGPVTFYITSKAFEMYLTVSKDDFVFLDEEGFTVTIGMSEFSFYFDNMEISDANDEYGRTFVLRAKEDDGFMMVV